MKVKILDSRSKGNGYLLQANNSETLMIEAGVDFKEVKKVLDFDLKGVVGCLISHEHGDHSKYIHSVMAAGIECYVSKGTHEALSLNHHRANILGEFEKISIGSYKVMPFGLKHDCKQIYGFLIWHEEMGYMTFLTDTFYCEYNFVGLNHIFIECNYAKDILNKNVAAGLIGGSLKNRTLKSHFSLENVKKFLSVTDLSSVKNICLLHLSDNNSDADRFKREIEDLTGKNIFIADKDIQIDLNLFPF